MFVYPNPAMLDWRCGLTEGVAYEVLETVYVDDETVDIYQYIIKNDEGVIEPYHVTWFLSDVFCPCCDLEVLLAPTELSALGKEIITMSLEDTFEVKLTPKKEVEHIDTGFEGLVYVRPSVMSSIDTKKLTEDQLNFLKKRLPILDFSVSIDNSILSEVSFNDIFKYEDEI